MIFQAPKLLWIAIIHVLLWNFLFSVSESIDVNESKDILLNNLHNRVRFTTHICKHVEPILEPEHRTPDALLSDSDGDVDHIKNPTLAQGEPIIPVKRHVITRCFNRAQENHEPIKLDPITSDWQIKSAPEYDHSTFQKSNINDKKKIDINLHTVIYQDPLSPQVPLLQTGNLIGANQKQPFSDSNLQDKVNKIKSLISSHTQKPLIMIQDKLLDESLHYKPALPSFNHPQPSKPPVLSPFIRPLEVHDYDVNTAELMKDNLLKKLSQLSPQIPYENVYQKDSIVENKPFSPPLQVNNNQKPIGISYDKRVPPFAYPPVATQFIKIPVTKPIAVPIFVKKEVSKYPTNERLQANIGSSSYPNIVNNGIAETTPQSIIMEKEVSISLPYKEPQQTSYLSPSVSLIKSTDAEMVQKQIAIEKEIPTSGTNGQNQPIIDLSLKSPHIANSLDKVSLYQQNPEQTIMLPANVPYEQHQPINSLSSPPQIVETFNRESTSQIIPIKKEVSISEPYVKPWPIINFSQLPQLPQVQQIKIQKVITMPSAYKQPIKGLVVPTNLIKTFNTELVSQPDSQEKKISLYESNNQQKPLIVLPSPPPLTKSSTTSAY